MAAAHPSRAACGCRRPRRPRGTGGDVRAFTEASRGGLRAAQGAQDVPPRPQPARRASMTAGDRSAVTAWRWWRSSPRSGQHARPPVGAGRDRAPQQAHQGGEDRRAVPQTASCSSSSATSGRSGRASTTSSTSRSSSPSRSSGATSPRPRSSSTARAGDRCARDEIGWRASSNVYSSRGLTWALLVFAAVLLFEVSNGATTLDPDIAARRRYNAALGSLTMNFWRRRIREAPSSSPRSSRWPPLARSASATRAKGKTVAERSTVTARVVLQFSSFFAWFLVLQRADPLRRPWDLHLCWGSRLANVTVWLLLFTARVRPGFTTALTAVSMPVVGEPMGLVVAVFETLLLYALTGAARARRRPGVDHSGRGRGPPLCRAIASTRRARTSLRSRSFYFFYICFQLIVVLLSESCRSRTGRGRAGRRWRAPRGGGW